MGGIREMAEKPKIVVEIDTGEVWQCPICKKWLRLIHRKPHDGHRLQKIEAPERGN